MIFGAVGMEGLMGAEAPSEASDPESKRKSIGSVMVKQERCGSVDNEWKSSKILKTETLSKTMPLHQGIPLLRSSCLLTDDDNGPQEHMLSFSSPTSEASFLINESALLGRNTQNLDFPYYQQKPSAFSRNAGYGSASMHGAFAGVRGPFTPSQWFELEQQALIYKYLTSNVPVPSNLLIPLKKSLYPFALTGSSVGSLAPTSIGWGSFHLGFSSNTDPEPGRCRRTDGKKWRCSRDAVPDQKYCERHINRGRHRSRKPVEGQTGHTASVTTNLKVGPMNSMPTSLMPSNGASDSLTIMQHQLKSSQPGAAVNHSPNVLVNRSLYKENVSGRVQEPQPQDLSIMSSSINLICNEDRSPSDFGLVSTNSILNNTSHRSCYMNPKNYGSFYDQDGTRDRHPLHLFVDDWPKDHSNSSVMAWPEELKSDWTQLSMSIPMTSSEFSSSSSSPTREKLALSPLRMSRELDPIQMTEKQTNRMPMSWGASIGGPLGEVLTNQLGYSPTGVLQKTAFCSLSNSSSGSSPRGENRKTHDGTSLYDDVLGSTLANSSIPSLV